jgi:hypothetical protein
MNLWLHVHSLFDVVSLLYVCAFVSCNKNNIYSSKLVIIIQYRTRLGLRVPRIVFPFPAGARDLSPVLASRLGVEPTQHPAFYTNGTVASLTAIRQPKRKAHRQFHLVPRLRKNGVTPPFPHTPAWRAQGQLYVYLNAEYIPDSLLGIRNSWFVFIFMYYGYKRLSRVNMQTMHWISKLGNASVLIA